MTDSASQNIFDRVWVRYLTVILAALAAYISTLGADFVHWDDRLLTENLALRGFSREHLLGLLLPRGAAYQPVRNLAFALTYHFFRLDPFGYHLVNLALYLMVTALAFRTLEVLAKRFPGAGDSSRGLIPWLGAALFALHPMHVEVVAWVQGNKDLLASVFFLAAFLSFEKHTRKDQGTRFYWQAYLLFLLALGSKPSAAAFPLVILAFDIFRIQTGSGKQCAGSGVRIRELALRHLPYWLPAALLAFYFMFFTSAMENTTGWADNILAIPMILWAYYRLMILPTGLVHRYIDPQFTGPADFAFLAGILITVAVFYFLFRKWRQHPSACFGLLWFYLCWLPQSNLAPLAIRVADRYIFLSLLGASLAAAVVMVRLLERPGSLYRAKALQYAIVALCIISGVMSAKRCLVWRDGEKLWSDGISKLPDRPFFYKGLAIVYLERGELDRAFNVYSLAAPLDPLDPAIPTNMGYIRKKQGRLDEAAAFYHRSLAVDSTSFNSLNSLGNIYARNGEDSLAAAYYLKAREYRPGNYMAATNLATLYRRLGRREEAERLMQGIENTILPEPVVLLKRGAVFLEEGLLDSAALRFKRALSLDSDLVTAEARLGEVYLRQDSLDLAVRHLRHVLVEGVPGWPLYNNMAIAYERLGRADSAAFFFRKAYETQPDSSSSTLKLAVALKSMDSTNVAVAMVKRLLETDFRNAPAHYNLGNWLVELGKYGEAAVHYQEALNINPKDVKTHLNLGLTYLQFLDSPEKALELLEECLRLDPHQAQAGRIRQTVEYLKARLR